MITVRLDVILLTESVNDCVSRPDDMPDKLLAQGISSPGTGSSKRRDESYVGDAECGPKMTSLQDRALLPKRQVLHEQNLLAAKEATSAPKQSESRLPMA